MSIIKSNMTAPPPPSGGALSSITEMNSLRFDGSSYLSFTPSSTGNSNIWTFSAWVKQSALPAGVIFNSGTSTRFLLGPYSTNGFYVLRYPSYPINAYTNAKYRDVSAFYHFVVEVNTNQSSLTDAFKIYQNGKLLTFSTTTYSSTTLNTNTSGVPMYIGQDGHNTNRWNGYMANIHLIDGQALDASHFGEEISGVWVPKAYDPATSGAYGTNGFHLDFAASNMDWTNSKVLDASGNGNDWNLN